MKNQATRIILYPVHQISHKRFRKFTVSGTMNMNLRTEILSEHSKRQCSKIIAYVGNSQSRFDKLIQLVLGNDQLIAQRAAWPLSYCVIAHPFLINKHVKSVVQHLKKPGLHPAVKRNAVRFLQFTDLPDYIHGDIMNICFQYIEDPNEAVAIKAFSLSILGRLAHQYPDIIPEISLLIEEQLPFQTAAFTSRAKSVLKKIKHQNSHPPI